MGGRGRNAATGSFGNRVRIAGSESWAKCERTVRETFGSPQVRCPKKYRPTGEPPCRSVRVAARQPTATRVGTAGGENSRCCIPSRYSGEISKPLGKAGGCLVTMGCRCYCSNLGSRSQIEMAAANAFRSSAS